MALVRVMGELGVLNDAELDAMKRHANPDVLNPRDEVVGELRSAFSLAIHARVGA